MTVSEVSRKEMQQFHQLFVLVEAILAILVGLLFLVWPIKSFTALVFFLGFWWFIEGIFDIIFLLVDSREWLLKLLMGILGIAAGLFLVQTPLQGAIVLPKLFDILIGLVGIVYGLLNFIAVSRGGSLSVAAIGLINIGMGVFIIFHFWLPALAEPSLFGVFALACGSLAAILTFLKK